MPQDFKQAAKWYRLAADQGHAAAQYNLRGFYERGQGVPQDTVQAMTWYLKAAQQQDALAQNNLGALLDTGNTAKLRVAAYALYNLSASNDPSSNNKATQNRAKLAATLSRQELEAGQALTRELAQSKDMAQTLALHVDKASAQAVKATTTSTKATAKSTPAKSKPVASADGFPAQPAKRPGVVSCSTRCVNAACWRTYDDGRKVHFQAKPKFDPFTNQMSFDAGMC